MDRRRTVFSGIRGILNWERRVIRLPAISDRLARERGGGRPGWSRDARRRLLYGLDEEQDRGDDEDVQRQRLDERQADDHDGLDAPGGARLARDGVHGGGRCPALAQAAQ